MFQSIDVIDYWFQAKVQSRYAVFARNSAFLAAVGIKVALIFAAAPLIAFAWAALAEWAFVAVALVAMYLFKGQNLLLWRVRVERARALIAESWPLIFSGTFVYINMLVDRIMIGQMSSDAEVGLFSAASRLSETLYLIPLVVGASIAPALVAERERNPERYQRKLQQIYDAMSFVALALAIPLTLSASSLMGFLYGKEYLSAAPMLAIHVWSGLFVFHVSIRSRSLVIENRQRFVALYAFLTMTVNVCLNLVLIPEFGGVGASVASLVSWMTCVLVFPLLSKATRDSVLMFLKSFQLFRFLREGLK
jgi:PST family polysaccharide transporter